MDLLVFMVTGGLILVDWSLLEKNGCSLPSTNGRRRPDSMFFFVIAHEADFKLI